jgi:hypothetical protein
LSAATVQTRLIDRLPWHALRQFVTGLYVGAVQPYIRDWNGGTGM